MNEGIRNSDTAIKKTPPDLFPRNPTRLPARPPDLTFSREKLSIEPQRTVPTDLFPRNTRMSTHPDAFRHSPRSVLKRLSSLSQPIEHAAQRAKTSALQTTGRLDGSLKHIAGQAQETIAQQKAKRAQKAAERKHTMELDAEKKARIAKERRALLKKLAPVGIAAAAAVAFPETRKIGVGAVQSLWESAMRGRITAYPLIDQAEGVIMMDGVPYFRRYAGDIFTKAVSYHPEIFDHTRDLPGKITCEVQQSDSLRYPNRPPETTNYYLQESREISELMTDGIANLYLDGLLTFPNTQEPLLLAEIQQQARLIQDAIQDTLRKTGKTNVAVASLNPQSRNNQALVTGALAMQELISFTITNGALPDIRLHNPIRSEQNISLPDPQLAAINRRQALTLELAYHEMDAVQPNHFDVDTYAKIRQFQQSTEGTRFIQDVYNQRIRSGLSVITKQPDGQPFRSENMGLSLIALHVTDKVNIHLLESITPENVAAMASKLASSGSRFKEFQLPGSMFTFGAGIIVAERGRNKPPAQVQNTSQPSETIQTPWQKVKTISRRTFLAGAGATAAGAAAIALETKLNPHPVVAEALFDGDTWERFLEKAHLLTREDLTKGFAGSTRFYYRDGTILLDGANEQSKKGQFRETCPADEIPDLLKMAVVHTEDLRMYQHDGVDPVGIARALKAKIKGGHEGASTIAMQVVRNVFGNIAAETRDWDNKKIEVVGALFLFQHEKAKAIAQARAKGISLTDEQARKQAHDKILVDYLNIAPFRGNVLGVKKAAEVLFGVKSPKELTELQQIFLAGLPKSPVDYDPFQIGLDKKGSPNGRKLDNGKLELFQNHPAMQRMQTVISMLENDLSSPMPADKLAQLKKQASQSIVISIPPSNIVSPAFAYAKSLYDKIPVEQLSAEADVVTTIDRRLDLQVKQIAEQAIQQLNTQYGVNRLDIVVRDIATGNILSLYGSPGQSHMIGSIAKAYTVAGAMESGVKPQDAISDQPFEVRDEKGNVTYKSRNFDGAVHGNGSVTVNEALEQSYNNPFLHLVRTLGLPRVIEMMQRLGAVEKHQLLNLNTLGPTITLGTNPITNALRVSSTFAALTDGRLRGSSGIDRILDTKGAILYQRKKDSSEQVVDPTITSDFLAMLSNEAYKLKRFKGKRYIVKTGTSTNETEDAAQGAYNGWTAGYALVDPNHRYQITCVAYRDDGQTPLAPDAGGENTAGEVYKRIADFLNDTYQP